MLLVHVLGIITNVVGVAIAWIVWRRDAPTVATCRIAMNFQITMMLTSVPLIIASLVPANPAWFLIAMLAFAGAASVVRVVFGIVGAIRATRGEVYRYPLAIPWLGNPPAITPPPK